MVSQANICRLSLSLIAISISFSLIQMSINQYSSEFHYHSLMWQQQQQHHQQNEVVEEKEALFEKPLTPSDVGKLNRLVIPKQHAERYFPLAAAAVDAV